MVYDSDADLPSTGDYVCGDDDGHKHGEPAYDGDGDDCEGGGCDMADDK